MTKLTVFTDGGARGNPGPAAIGVVLTSESGKSAKGTVVANSQTTKIGEYIGPATNNIAEYTAILKALEVAKDQKASELTCFLDSELVVKQLSGSYKVKDANLKKLWEKVKIAEKHFKKVTYNHVPRTKNKEADKIVNEVLDSVQP